MTIGIENITSASNQTAQNMTANELGGKIGSLLGNSVAGSYDIVGFIFMAAFAVALYKSKVSVDVGAVFMVPALFVFGKYGLLPGGTGTVYGLVLAVGGLLAAGLFRYFR